MDAYAQEDLKDIFNYAGTKEWTSEGGHFMATSIQYVTFVHTVQVQKQPRCNVVDYCTGAKLLSNMSEIRFDMSRLSDHKLKSHKI